MINQERSWAYEREPKKSTNSTCNSDKKRCIYHARDIGKRPKNTMAGNGIVKSLDKGIVWICCNTMHSPHHSISKSVSEPEKEQKSATKRFKGGGGNISPLRGMVKTHFMQRSKLYRDWDQGTQRIDFSSISMLSH